MIQTGKRSTRAGRTTDAGTETPTAEVRKSKRRQPTTLIVNPSEGKARTTAQAARRMVIRGLAVWVGTRAIQMLSHPVFAGRDSWIDREIDAGIAEKYPAGIVFWNGCDHRRMAMHLPGHMLAFERPSCVR